MRGQGRRRWRLRPSVLCAVLAAAATLAAGSAAAAKTDPDHAALTLWTALCAIGCLRITLYPYLPFTSQRLHEMLGLGGRVEDSERGWDEETLTPRCGARQTGPAVRQARRGRSRAGGGQAWRR